MLEIVDNELLSFEEALDRAGFGIYSYSMTALAGVVIVSFVCIFYSTTIVVPLSACELATTGAQQGVLVAGPIVGAITGAVFWGYLADRYGRKRTLMVSLLCGATVNALASLSVNWLMMLILQFIASVMISGQFSLAMTILSESVPAARRNLVILLVTSIFLLSQGLMAVLAMPIIPLTYSYHVPYLDIRWNSWRTVLVVYSLPSLLTAYWLYLMQESPKFVYSKGNEQRALHILRIIHRINHRTHSDGFQVCTLLKRNSLREGRFGPPTPVEENHLLTLFKPPLLKNTVIMTLLFLLEQLAAFKVWLPSIAHRFMQVFQTGEEMNRTLCEVIAPSASWEAIDEVDPTIAPCTLDFSALLIVLVITMMMSATNILVTLVVSRVGRRNMAIIITSTAGFSGILVNLVPNTIGSAALFVLQLMGIVVVGLYIAICVALFPTHLRALAMTLTMTGSRIANFVSIQVINYLLVYDCNLAFFIYGSLLMLSVVVALGLPNDYRKEQSNYEVLSDAED